MTPTLFIVTGISGSGKTTIARALAARGELALDSKLVPGLFHFEDAEGHVPASNHPNDQAWLAGHKWVLDREVFHRTLAQHPQAKRAFLCGGGDSLKALWPEAAAVFLLKIDEETLLARLNDPQRDNRFAGNTATQQRLLNRLPKYQQANLNQGAVAIDATQPAGQVVDAILAACEGHA
jgi:thymidylate kinase